MEDALRVLLLIQLDALETSENHVKLTIKS